MKPTVYWIEQNGPGKLGIMSRPRGGDWLEDEMSSLKNSGVDVIVSMLTAEEVSELELISESAICKLKGIEFISFPIVDRDVPSVNPKTFDMIKGLEEMLSDSLNIVIHCRMGIGRSSLIAASVLAVRGVTVNEAFRLIEISRGCSVPDTPEQREWVSLFKEQFIK